MRELGLLSRLARNVLMILAPSLNSLGTNDLFNSGYGGFVTIMFQACFVVTFIYYAVTNTTYNLNTRFLAPLTGESAGICVIVPSEISRTFTTDMNGKWDSEKGFVFGQTLYGLSMANVKFEDGETTYTTQMDAFIEDLNTKSQTTLNGDYAWNLAFAGSYSTTSFDNGGKSSFYIDADSRLLYDKNINSAGQSIHHGIRKLS